MRRATSHKIRGARCVHCKGVVRAMTPNGKPSTGEQCGQVEPRRIQIGTVKWVGASTPEPLFMVAYERCQSTETERTKSGACFCWDHWRGTKLYLNARVFINGIELKQELRVSWDSKTSRTLSAKSLTGRAQTIKATGTMGHVLFAAGRSY